MKTVPLPGLERLLDASRKYALQVRSSPPACARSPGELLLGRPFDPMLAAFYQRLGGLSFPLNLYIASCDEQMDEIFQENKDVQPWWPEPFRSLLVFGGEEALLYRYATVPSLADAQGFQPVVKVDPYEEIYALPIASNVDRFFDTYARYLELVYGDPDFGVDCGTWPVFPWGVPEIISTDRALMSMLVDGRFDSLMFPHESLDTDGHEEIRKWIAELRAASR